jgi:hypothetical protein
MVTKEMISSTKILLLDYIMSKWLAEEVFYAKWWFMVAFIVLSYIFVFSILEKCRYTQLLFYGSLGTVFSLVLVFLEQILIQEIFSSNIAGNFNDLPKI